MSERQPRRQVAALLALTRVDHNARSAAIIRAALKLSLNDLDPQGRESLVFVLDRFPLGELLTAEEQQELPRLLGDMLIHIRLSQSPALGRLLSRWAPQTLIAQATSELAAATTQRDQMQLLHMLSMCAGPRTPDQRALLISRLAEMQDYPGGDGMPTFRGLIENAAIEKLPESDRPAARASLDSLRAGFASRWQPSERREPVRDWSPADFATGTWTLEPGRDFEQGRKMFREARCLQCHRMGAEGGLVGPDLSSVGRRFAAADVLTSILEPSRVVAEKYRQSVFVLKDGRVVTGSEAAGGDYRSPTLIIQTDPLDPAKTVEVVKSEIEDQQESPTSRMPQGLLNTLQQEEILDLLAYLIAGGDAAHPLFRMP